MIDPNIRNHGRSKSSTEGKGLTEGVSDASNCSDNTRHRTTPGRCIPQDLQAIGNRGLDDNDDDDDDDDDD